MTTLRGTHRPPGLRRGNLLNHVGDQGGDRMSALYGCVVCGTPRPAEMDWDWIVQHRALGCAGARWGMLEERP